MKKLLFTMAALLLLALPSSAMSYEQARQQALFLTDKMAYELNLSEAQYEAAYEINLDYLMSINTVDDLAGNYWRWRNLDMSYVLLGGSIAPSATPPTSIARSIGTPAAGTSPSTPAIPIATTTISAAPPSTASIVAPTP